MKKLVTIVLVMVVSIAQAQEKEVVKRFKTQVYFDTDKYIIKTDEQRKLNSIADTLLKYGDYQVRLYGHTDSIGSLEYNQKLSRNRLLAVQGYLYQKGVDSSHVKFGYFGETRPQVPNSNEQNKARNRRVEIVVTLFKAVEIKKKGVIIEDIIVEDEGCTEGDTVIVLASGTEIVIPGCAFGEFKRSEICIEFEEATTPEDIEEHSLNTETTDGDQLVSFGMFKFTATVCKTGRLVENISDSIFIQFPYYGPYRDDYSSCIPTNIGMYKSNGKEWEPLDGRVASIVGSASRTVSRTSNTARRFLKAPLATLNGQWVNCDAPLLALGGGALCGPNTRQAFKVREYTLDKVYLTYTFAEGINTRLNFGLVQSGKKAKARVFCQSCYTEPQVRLWVWAHDKQGNKFVIKGAELSMLKARKSFKHCQTDFIGILPGLCIKRKGTTVRKFILFPSDFEPDNTKKKPKKEPVLIQLS